MSIRIRHTVLDHTFYYMVDVSKISSFLCSTVKALVNINSVDCKLKTKNRISQYLALPLSSCC